MSIPRPTGPEDSGPLVPLLYAKLSEAVQERGEDRVGSAFGECGEAFEAACGFDFEGGVFGRVGSGLHSVGGSGDRPVAYDPANEELIAKKLAEKHTSDPATLKATRKGMKLAGEV